MVLAEKKMDVELIEERLGTINGILRRNPAGKVPILRHEGALLTESTPICEHIEELNLESLILKDAKALKCADWYRGLMINFTTR